MRFGKENRLRLAREIEFLKANSAKADCSAFVIYLYPVPARGHSRIAIIASRRIGNAVSRNAARRRFREIFRAWEHSSGNSSDILIFVRRGWSAFSHEKLAEKFCAAAKSLAERFKPRPGATPPPSMLAPLQSARGARQNPGEKK